MIFGIGTDIVRVDRMQRNVQRTICETNPLNAGVRRLP